MFTGQDRYAVLFGHNVYLLTMFGSAVACKCGREELPHAQGQGSGCALLEQR